MKTLMKYILLITFSGYLYVTLELIFRGRSDVSMMYCASICAIPMIILNNIFSYDVDFALQIFICGAFSTAVEWITGLLVNADHHIWDYTNMPLHSPDGQVCAIFAFLWMFISALVIPLMDFIDWKLFNYKPDTPPYYVVFGKKTFSMDPMKGSDWYEY